MAQLLPQRDKCSILVDIYNSHALVANLPEKQFRAAFEDLISN